MYSEGAKALSSEARPKIVTLASNNGLRPTRSPIGPAESAPTMMPMLDHRNAVVKAGPGRFQTWVSEGTAHADRIDVVAVADLDQSAERRDADLQAADPLVLERPLRGRKYCFRHPVVPPRPPLRSVARSATPHKPRSGLNDLN